jgi:hypothetical protein
MSKFQKRAKVALLALPTWCDVSRPPAQEETVEVILDSGQEALARYMPPPPGTTPPYDALSSPFQPDDRVRLPPYAEVGFWRPRRSRHK